MFSIIVFLYISGVLLATSWSYESNTRLRDKFSIDDVIMIWFWPITAFVLFGRVVYLILREAWHV